jgi:ABC-2 type transport system permease protein
MLGVINNAFANSSSSIIIAKVQGNATDFLMSPLSALELAAAFIGGAAARGVLVGVMTALALAPFADLTPAHWAAVAYFGVTASVLFGALGLIGGVWADKFDKLATVTNFIILPLTFLSGTFYAIDALPEPLRSIGHYNPVFLLIDGFRYGFTGVADGAPLWNALGALACAAGLCVAAWAVLRSGWKLKA